MTRYILGLVLFLTACGADPTRYALPPSPDRGKIPVAAGSVEVREVTLPTYASLETIFTEGPDGALIENDDLLWADDPRRAFTEGLALSLASLTRARVAAEPWPFFGSPEARVEVRFTRALASRDGRFRISGQYFVASAEGNRADVARRFDLAEPIAASNAVSIAAAKARAIDALARLIARDGL